MRHDTLTAQAERPRIADLVAAAQKRAAIKTKQDAATPLQMLLPGMDELMRAMPNLLARSSLCAPVAKGKRKMHSGTVLVSRKDAVIEYWGEQLDEADADILLQLTFRARHSALGTAVTINRAAFLRELDRATGKHDYDWLHRRLKAMSAATLIVEAKSSDGTTKYRIGDTKTFHILAGFGYDARTEAYTYTLDPQWRVLFGNREFALIDWPKRLQIGRGQDMAKALQRLVATSSNRQQQYALEWLQIKLQYTGRMRDFRGAMNRAMHELERINVIARGRIETSTKGKEQAAWTKL
ncbi:hypothetical protein [Candidatus Ferrigenium straubiae]|jgi:hypothetical protein|uniref:hypothetical protein n=1 Tax=Candidatus Ferrigenium straubiae TaxID=2919506 RepID=UPI003F4AC34B